MGVTAGKLCHLVFLYLCAREDFRIRQLSMIRLLLLGGIGCIWYGIVRPFSVLELAGGIGIGMILLFTAYISRENIGVGDGWLFCVSGIFGGLRVNLMLLVFSCLLCAAYSLMMLLRRRWNRKDRVAFAPFVLAAYPIVLWLSGS